MKSSDETDAETSSKSATNASKASLPLDIHSPNNLDLVVDQIECSAESDVATSAKLAISEECDVETSSKSATNAPKASMDVHSLNNLVTGLRKLMKNVRARVIQKLIRKSKQLRGLSGTEKMKSCPEEKKTKNMEKANRLIADVGTLRELDIDHAIKFVLGNTSSFSAVAGSCDVETRARLRLAEHPLMMERVKKWRSEHEDWKELAAFIVSKNTGRRMVNQKKKNKQKNPKVAQKKRIDISNVEAEEEKGLTTRQMARIAKRKEKYLIKSKLKPLLNEGSATSKETPLSEIDSASNPGMELTNVTESPPENETAHERMRVQDKKSDSSSEESDDSNSENGNDKDEKSNDKEEPLNDKEETSNAKIETSIDKKETSNKTSGRNKKTETKGTAMDKKKNNNKKSSQFIPTETKVKPFVKFSGDMVVSKIDMTSLPEDAIIPLIPTKKDIEDKKEKEEKLPETNVAKKRKRDAFFLAEGSDSDSSSDGDYHVERPDDSSDDEEHKMDVSRAKLDGAFLFKLGQATTLPKRPKRQEEDTMRGSGQRGPSNDSRRLSHGQEGNRRPMENRGGTKRGDKDESLHPSWEARRKKKDQEKNIFSFAGKRTTFDDD